MSENYLGQVSIFAFQFAPRGFAQCNGQLMPIIQNTALFALLGTTYGGDGRSTFALPNLKGRVAIDQGQGQSLSLYTIGEAGGEAAHTLTTAELPQHTHAAHYASDTSQLDPGTRYWAQDTVGNVTFSTTHDAVLRPDAITTAGGSQPHENNQPYLVVNFCISLVGIFPSQT
jgi:microcystin-dependent protein